ALNLRGTGARPGLTLPRSGPGALVPQARGPGHPARPWVPLTPPEPPRGAPAVLAVRPPPLADPPLHRLGFHSGALGQLRNGQPSPQHRGPQPFVHTPHCPAHVPGRFKALTGRLTGPQTSW